MVFLGSAITDVEIRATMISVPLHLAQGRGVHRGELFPEYCRWVWGPPNPDLPVGRFTRRSRARHLQNSADGKLFDRRPSYCRIVLRMTRPTSDRNLGSEKFRMAKLLWVAHYKVGNGRPAKLAYGHSQWYEYTCS
jgi:hypothetical protein